MIGDYIINDIEKFNKDAVTLAAYKKVRADGIFAKKMSDFETESKPIALLY